VRGGSFVALTDEISVLMAVHAGETPEHLRQSLESLVSQTLQPFEVVLVEDGPIGVPIRQTIEQFADRLNIVSVRLARNAGLASALNAGLRACRCELVARLDSDDIAMPGRLAVQSELFRRDLPPDVASGFVEEMGAADVPQIRTVPVGHERIVGALWSNPFAHPAVMYRRSKIIAVGGYDESVRRGQDYELWFRCAEAGLRFDNVPSVLIRYRFNAASLTRASIAARWRRALIGFRGSRRIGLPLWKQLACFAPFIGRLLPRQLNMIAYRLSQRLKGSLRDGP
jgi:glycosyltransferase involved in cell wall biosynthesis